jgi:hypothetical protein
MTTDPRLIAAFFHVWMEPHPHAHVDGEDPDSDLVWTELNDKLIDSPEETWRIILDLVEAAPDEEMLMMVGIAPLRDFLSHNGRSFIDRVEQEIKTIPRFRAAVEHAGVDASHELVVQQRLHALGIGPPGYDPTPIEAAKPRRYRRQEQRERHRPLGFATPEQAAVASFPPSASARVVRVEVKDATHVDVIVDTEPSHLMRVHCQRRGNNWYEAGEIVE